MTESLVLYEVRDGAALITFNRPGQRNGWTPPLQVAYYEALRRAAADDAVGAIVVTGAGRSFCPGADTEYLKQIEAAGQTAAHADPMIFPLRIPKLTVAAINGGCAGIGLVHALVCDVRFVATTAKLTTAFARRGLAAEHGISWLLPRVVGGARAADLLLSGRVITAAEAVTLGLATAAVEPEALLAHALGYAQDVAANCSPASIAAIKAQLLSDATRDVEAAYAAAAGLMRQAVQGPDFAEGVASFLQRRPPAFPPLGKGTVFEGIDPLRI
ncbi:enoyl-CoA hydratase-related protein [Dactylosporangium sp. CA-092794]|uniref:enoyl-CoA hydratase-related protein n=1 Tax=Dactylosporangium sp. CA-092794 TaxID=3239929 RepID=UPI003D8AA9F0